MTLDEFRIARRWTYAQLARALGRKERVVRRWCLPFDNAEFRLPRPEAMAAIVAVTDGQVTAADFYAPPTTRAAA